MRKIGFVICSRVDSERLPRKVFRKINGVPLIEHLLRRLTKVGLPIVIAVPNMQAEQYRHLESYPKVTIFPAPPECDQDPLKRMTMAAESSGFADVIRVTHDKIFVEEDNVWTAIDVFRRKGLDYLFGSSFIPGTGFEIISLEALRAAGKFANVEYVGYAVKAVTKNVFDFSPSQPAGSFRFLVDYAEDIQLLEVVFSQLGNEASLADCVSYLKLNHGLKRINAQPRLTIYTCAYNAAPFLDRCLNSVRNLRGFSGIEYIIIDDHSSDKTPEIAARFCLENSNARWIRNPENLGLASSSNVALRAARGKYIIRMDADDFFATNKSAHELLSEIELSGKDAIYPNNYFGDWSRVQLGKDCHHVGGAIFRTSAVNHFKFSEGLRGYEGLEFFTRAREHLNIGYLNKPTFFYTQRNDSMSKTNLLERAEILSKIEGSSVAQG